jgi:DNA-binding NtrC family response regulator
MGGVKGRSILVLDDNRDAADTLAALLATEGYAVRLAYGVRDALDILDDDLGIAAVVADVRMPDVDGFDFLRVVRLRRPSVNVILITGQPITDKDVVPRGATILQKPVALRALLDALASAEAQDAERR